MKQIKTVICPIEYAYSFDKEVNRLIADGWTIARRDIIRTAGEVSEAYNTAIIQALYAELERYTKPYPEEVTL